jgi:hypothetical protein
MATQNTGSSQSPKPKAKPKATANTAPQTKSSSAPSRAEQARIAAERAVDLPVGAALEVSDAVAGLVEPLSGRNAAQKQLESYKTQLRRTVKRTERRGATARRKATTEARKTRNRVEREARKRQQRVRKAVDEQTNRAQGFVDQVGEQLAALR